MDKKNKIYDLAGAVHVVKSQDFKHVNLCELDGSPIVTWNIVAKPVKPKLDEIQRRWTTLSDGVYVMNCKTVYGSRARAFPLYVGKGVYDDTIIEGVVPGEKKEPVAKLSEVNVLSYEQALEKASKINSLEFRVTTLEKENAELKKENSDLEAELAELENKEPEEKGLADFGTTVKDWLGEIGPVLAPIADKFFAMKEKQIQLEQIKVLSHAGYEIPGVAKKPVLRNGAEKIDYSKNIPAPDSAGWDGYIDWVCSLPDEQFNAHLDQLKATDQALYDRVESEVLEDGKE